MKTLIIMISITIVMELGLITYCNFQHMPNNNKTEQINIKESFDYMSIPTSELNDTILLKYLREETTIEEYMIVLAQSVLETGWFTSPICLNKNNILGLYDSSKNTYYEFNHWTDCILAYKEWIYDKYPSYVDYGYIDYLIKLPYATDKDYKNKLEVLALELYKKHIPDEYESGVQIYNQPICKSCTRCVISNEF